MASGRRSAAGGGGGRHEPELGRHDEGGDGGGAAGGGGPAAAPHLLVAHALAADAGHPGAAAHQLQVRPCLLSVGTSLRARSAPHGSFTLVDYCVMSWRACETMRAWIWMREPLSALHQPGRPVERPCWCHRPRMCILGSRQQMCVHPTVSRLSGPACNQACKALTAKRQCPWCDAVCLRCTSTTSQQNPLNDPPDEADSKTSQHTCPCA